MHLIPFQGEVEWDKFIKGLKDIKFDGCISLETGINRKTPLTILEQMQISLAQLARWFASQIEKN